MESAQKGLLSEGGELSPDGSKSLVKKLKGTLQGGHIKFSCKVSTALLSADQNLQFVSDVGLIIKKRVYIAPVLLPVFGCHPVLHYQTVSCSSFTSKCCAQMQAFGPLFC